MAVKIVESIDQVIKVPGANYNLEKSTGLGTWLTRTDPEVLDVTWCSAKYDQWDKYWQIQRGRKGVATIRSSDGANAVEVAKRCKEYDDEYLQKREAAPFWKPTEADYEALIGWLEEEFRQEFKKQRIKGELEFDDEGWGNRLVSVYVRLLRGKVYDPDKAKGDHFTFSIDFADAYSKTEEDAKTVIKSRLRDEVSEFKGWVLHES